MRRRAEAERAAIDLADGHVVAVLVDVQAGRDDQYNVFCFLTAIWSYSFLLFDKIEVLKQNKNCFTIQLYFDVISESMLREENILGKIRVCSTKKCETICNICFCFIEKKALLPMRLTMAGEKKTISSYF